MGRFPIIVARTTPSPRGMSAARADGGGAVVGDARPTAPQADDGGTVMPRAPGWRPRPEVAGVRRFPTRRIIMDEVEFHCEPPSNISMMVTAFSGWIDAGEAATDAMRFLVRQLAAEPLAAIDLEDFVDFTQVRPVVRLSAEGERTIRWPRSAFWFWQ